jgi:hypothetical protein
MKVEPIKDYQFPPGFDPQAKAFKVGECTAIVEHTELLGWHVFVFNHKRPPHLRELLVARRRLVPPGLQVSMLLDYKQGTDDAEVLRYVHLVEHDLPKIITFGGGNAQG